MVETKKGSSRFLGHDQVAGHIHVDERLPVVRLPSDQTKFRYLWLLATLLMMLILGPLVGRFQIIVGGLYVGDFVLAVVLLSAVRLLFHRHLHFLVCLLFALVAIGAGGASRLLDGESVTIARVTGHASEACLLAYLSGLIARDIFTTDDVDFDTISGSISIYLLLAAFFAVIFTILENLDPSAFRLPADIRISDPSLGPDRLMVYFSITTITTLGYGDITPRNEMARSLSNLEALLGQVYLTVLVARLVGRNLTRAFASSS